MLRHCEDLNGNQFACTCVLASEVLQVTDQEQPRYCHANLCSGILFQAFQEMRVTTPVIDVNVRLDAS